MTDQPHDTEALHNADCPECGGNDHIGGDIGSVWSCTKLVAAEQRSDSARVSVTVGPCQHQWAQSSTTGSWSCWRCNTIRRYDDPPGAYETTVSAPLTPKPTASGGGERDQLGGVLEALDEALRQYTEPMSLLNSHELGERLGDDVAEIVRHARARATLAQPATREDALREALEPSADTKAAYSGEIEYSYVEIDEFGDERTVKRLLDWTTIKEVMAMIRARAAQSDSAKAGA